MENSRNKRGLMNLMTFGSYCIAAAMGFIGGYKTAIDFAVPKTEPAIVEQTKEYQTQNPVVWHAYYKNQDGNYDSLSGLHDKEIIKPDQNHNQLERMVLEAAQQVNKFKIELSKKETGHDLSLAPGLCVIEDRDGDGKADVVSWPRSHFTNQAAPIFVARNYEDTYLHSEEGRLFGEKIRPMSQDLQEQATNALMLERLVQTYVKTH